MQESLSLQCILGRWQSDAGFRTSRKPSESWVPSLPSPPHPFSLSARHLSPSAGGRRRKCKEWPPRLVRSSSFVTTPPNSETVLCLAAFHKDSNAPAFFLRQMRWQTECVFPALVLCLLQGKVRKYPRKCSELMGWKQNHVSRFDLETSVGRARVLSGARADLQRRPSLPGN